MKRGTVQAIYTLSPQQQGMLFETLYRPESGIHVEQMVCTLQGQLDLVAFEQAWEHIMARHQILRTGFAWKKQKEPVQVVLKQVNLQIEKQDWRHLSISAQQDCLQSFLKQDYKQGFDVTKPPLMRVTLFQIEDNACDLVWTHHHILLDGWCRPILFKEFLSAYEAIKRGSILPVTNSRPYGDYVSWLSQQDLSSAQIFWQKTLKGFTEPTPLGINAERIFDDVEGADRFGEHLLRVSAPVTEALQTFTRQSRLTLNSLIQGVWALLLNHYSGNDDVLFGTTVSGRPPELDDVESMIGLFINTLPFRVKVHLPSLFSNWLKYVQDTYMELRPFEYASAGQIHQWSDMPGRRPLYESLLVFENYPVNSEIQALKHSIGITNIRSRGAQTKHPLTLLVFMDTELTFRLIYDRTYLPEVESHKILKHWQLLLEKISADPTQTNQLLVDQISNDDIPVVNAIKNYPKDVGQRIEPRNSVEKSLVLIWKNVLDVEEVSIYDNWFDLGGHSLLAIQVVSEVREVFHVEVPLGYLFEAPVLADFAVKITQKLADQMEDEELVTQILGELESLPQEKRA